MDVLKGRYCCCVPLNLDRHSLDLFHAYRLDSTGKIWTYLPYGPFYTLKKYQQWMREYCFNGDPLFYAIIDNSTNKAAGVASYLRIYPQEGSIEVGHINYSPALQNTIAGTEAQYLMMKNAFSLGYRRYEWKCNALNQASCNAALRLGFTYEGIFRQMCVVKGRNRDSAWYSLLDREWPKIDQAFQAWLSTNNFDNNGKQRQSLSVLTGAALASIAYPKNTTRTCNSSYQVVVKPVKAENYDEWCKLYRAYARFYKVPMNEHILTKTWGWLLDPAHEVQGLLAFPKGQDRPCGLAHIRRMPSPLRGTEIGFLDDLFVAPDKRGHRIGEALFDALRSLAKSHGWSKIRWITADDNYRARRLYDKLSTKTSWNTYEMEIH